MLVEESLMLAVPNGLSAEHAALTEPMAIGWHAVRRSEVKKGDVAIVIVIGCGPVGLAVVSMLTARGVRSIVASDFSPGGARWPPPVVPMSWSTPLRGRRSTAQMSGRLMTIPEAAELGVGTTKKLRRLPLPWHHVWRTVEALGLKPKRPVVFECIGVPGVTDAIITAAPLWSRDVVADVCTTPTRSVR